MLIQSWGVDLDEAGSALWWSEKNCDDPVSFHAKHIQFWPSFILR